MKILVLNCGSSSLKFQLIDMDKEERIVKGNFERIGGKCSNIRLNVRGNKSNVPRIARDYEEAIISVLNLLQDPKYNIIENLEEISAIGHRIVHGGEYFSDSVLNLQYPPVRVVPRPFSLMCRFYVPCFR